VHVRYSSGSESPEQRSNSGARTPGHFARTRRLSRLQFWKHRSVDLLIMTHRYCRRFSPVGRNVALRAARVLGKPILLLSGDAIESAFKFKNNTAVAAVSLSEHSRAVVETTARLAGALSCSVRVLHIVDALHDVSRPDNLMSLMCSCELLGRSVVSSSTTSEVRYSRGSVGEALSRHDLGEVCFLALGVDPAGEIKDGSIPEAMLHQIMEDAPCPILLVPTSSHVPARRRAGLRRRGNQL
jgi:hypothetical protein